MVHRVLLAFALCSSIAVQAQSLTAEQLVNKWRIAIHAEARAGKDAVNATLLSTQDGIAGQVHFWNDGLSYREEISRNFDESDLVLTPQTQVRRDWNGWLRKMEGRELARLRTALMERSVALLGPTPEMTRGSVSTTSDGRTYVLRYDPTGANTTTWYIDTTTLLPIRSEHEGEDSIISTSYSDWRPGEAPAVPHKAIVSETEKPNYSWELKSVSFQKTVPHDVFVAPKAELSDTMLASNVPPIPFTFEANHITFQMSLNGRKPLGWILDTGADQEVINSTRLKDFGLTEYAKTSTTGGGNAADYGYARGATFELPGIVVRDQHVATIDQTGLEQALGIPLGGIVGYDFISRFVIEIDYEKQLMTLYDPKKWEYKGTGAAIPIVFDNGIPHTNVFVSVATHPNIPAYMVMDFGAAETMTFTSPFVDKYDLRKIAGTNSTLNRPAGMEKQFFAQTNTRGRVEELKLGPMVIRSIPVNLSANTTGAYASKEFDGTIGESIDSRYHVFLDYARQRIIFEPTEATTKAFSERQTFGILFLASGNDLHTYTVVAIRPGSPAERAGFRKGDVISAVDGNPSPTFPLSQLREWMSHPGEKHEFAVARMGETLTIPVTVELISVDRQ